MKREKEEAAESKGFKSGPTLNRGKRHLNPSHQGTSGSCPRRRTGQSPGPGNNRQQEKRQKQKDHQKFKREF